MQDLKLRWKVTRKWLHRYAGLISFCGVALVLAILIVKDVLRDEGKDAVSAMETAQRAYDSTLATDLIHDWLIDPQLMKLRNSSPVNSAKYSLYSTSGTDPLPGIDDTLAYISVSLRRVTILRESLPKKEANQAGKSANEFEQESEMIRQDALELERAPAEVEPNLLVSWGNHLLKSAQNVRVHLAFFEQELRQQLVNEARKGTRRLKRFTYLSYFLYPAGVLIGVLGQLAGVKAAGGE
jgi:hypothetical protein